MPVRLRESRYWSRVAPSRRKVVTKTGMMHAKRLVVMNAGGPLRWVTTIAPDESGMSTQASSGTALTCRLNCSTGWPRGPAARSWLDREERRGSGAGRRRRQARPRAAASSSGHPRDITGRTGQAARSPGCAGTRRSRCASPAPGSSPGQPWKVSWTATRLADESERLDLLTAGDLEIRASSASGYHGLAETDQRAFRMLGPPAADFPARNLAAALQTGTDDAWELPEQLVDTVLSGS